MRWRKCYKVWIVHHWPSIRHVRLLFDGWIGNSMFSRTSLLDKGWKFWCRGIRGEWKLTSVFWQWRCWSHWWGSKDTAKHDFFNPTSLYSRDCKLTTQRCKVGVLAHASIFRVTILSWIQMPWNSWHSPHKGPHAIVALPNGQKKPCSTS